MRTLLAVSLTALLLAPMGALAESGTIWVDARGQQDAGTFGGLTLSMGNGTGDASTSADYNELPNIVEVSTATWCIDAVLIHYHRVWYEIEDPFGSDSTEERWEGVYGDASKEAIGSKRAAPTSVIDGQRMHTGSTAKGISLLDDYSQSLQVGNRAWFMDGTIDFSVSFSDSVASFSWNFDNLVSSCADDCPTQTTTPWVLFVEDSARFEDGSNNLEEYIHVNHAAVQLSGFNGTETIDVPSAWDGEDMNAVLLIDWEVEQDQGRDIFGNLPGIGVASLFSLLAAAPLVRSRQH